VIAVIARDRVIGKANIAGIAVSARHRRDRNQIWKIA
jgi:hypothetical protein